MVSYYSRNEIPEHYIVEMLHVYCMNAHPNILQIGNNLLQIILNHIPIIVFKLILKKTRKQIIIKTIF